MDLLPQFLTQISGGVAAAIADRQFAGYSVDLGPVHLTPGAMGALALTGLSLAGIKLPFLPKQLVANLAGGALIYEGTKAGEEQVVPLLERMFPGLMPGSSAPALPVAGEDYAGGYLTTGLPDQSAGDDYDLSSGLAAFRSMY